MSDKLLDSTGTMRWMGCLMNWQNNNSWQNSVVVLLLIRLSKDRGSADVNGAHRIAPSF